ncbi:MAG: hypothetical protein U1C71_00075 [archaeon]|nr:hypothetical protein [archaeon]
MSIPNIHFQRSWVYEQKWWEFRLTKPPRISEEAANQLFKQIKERKPLFEHLLGEITRTLQITWKRKEIEVTMIALFIGSFSKPLTISLSDAHGHPNDIEDLIDIIIHELIHNALNEHPQINAALTKIRTDYPDEPFLTHIHILVHALHMTLYEQHRGMDRAQRDIDKSALHPSYAKAWQIVTKEGAENILNKYLSD